MLNLKLDYNGQNILHWPKKPAQVIALAEQYIAYETSLPAALQLSNITPAVLQPWLDAARAAVNAAARGEADRGSHAETLRQALRQLTRWMDNIYILLRAKNVDNLAGMEYWGFPATQGVHGIIVRKPYGQTALIHWLMAYIAKETSLPEVERIAHPSLSQMQALLTTIQTALAWRDSGRIQRETYLATRNQEVDMLLNFLQLAAANRVMLSYQGVVTPDLKRWGFVVQAWVRPATKN